MKGGGVPSQLIIIQAPRLLGYLVDEKKGRLYMFIIKKHRTPQKYRSFIAKLPIDYQLKANGGRYIATRLHTGSAEAITENVIFDVNDSSFVECFKMLLKYTQGDNVEVLSASEVMLDYSKDGFRNSWTLLYLMGIKSIECGW